MTAITGNTYPVKDSLKALGARWNSDQKAWMIDDEKADQARKIVAGAPASNSTERRPYHPTQCATCGVRQRKMG